MQTPGPDLDRLRRTAAAALLVSLVASTPASAYEVNDWLAVEFRVATVGQCQTLQDTADASTKNECRGAQLLQPAIRLRPFATGEAYVRAGFAWGDSVNEIPPFQQAPWGADVEEVVENVNGRRDYLLEAWYAQRLQLPWEIEVRISGGIIDATRYLDQNAYANDETTQFMNGALVNGPNSFLPTYDWGGVMEVDRGPWGFKVLGMRVGRAKSDIVVTNKSNFNFYAAQIERTWTSRLGTGNYRLLGELTSRDFRKRREPGLTRQAGVSLSFDQELGEHLGAHLRVNWQDDDAVLQYDLVATGGLFVRGGSWGRPKDNVGLGYGFLDGGNAGLARSHVAEIYYRFVLNRWVAVSADAQFLRDRRKVGENPRGFVFGLRLVIDL